MSLTRKDFLNGLAFTAVTALSPGKGLAGTSGPDPGEHDYFLAQGIRQSDPRYYPPALTGMRGSHPGSFEVAHALRDGAQWTGAADRGERYDLIVVGGGLSGLAAAYFHRQQHGPQARILVLDNHDDFGGHARRNEFRGGSLLGYGGTQEIEGWPHWSPEAKGLLHDLGIVPERFEQQYYQRDFRAAHGLKHAIFFDRETFGADALVSDVGLPDWAAFAARTPLSPAARADLVRLQTQAVDYLPGLTREEKVRRLSKMSFATFLRQHARVDRQVIDFFRTFMTGGFGLQIDALPAWLCLKSTDRLAVYWDGQQGPSHAAVRGMGLDTLAGPGAPPAPFVYHHFPDGNASIARMLVRALIPGTAPGHTMEDIVTARLDYTHLDRPESPVRLRLNSTAVRVEHAGERHQAREVLVTYVQEGAAFRVRASTCILACYHSLIPFLCPELPDWQTRALSMGVKAPLVYVNVQLRNWHALQRLGLAMVYCPGSYFSEVYMDFPVSIGAYHYTRHPDEPVVLHMVHVPCQPGLPARQQRRAGQRALYTTPLATFEHHIRDQLERMLKAGGFDAGRDLEAITVNRWPHGYADAFCDLEDPDWPEQQRPNVIARSPFGRVAIANSDAAGSAQTQAAIDEAHRAVQELASLR